MTYTDWSLTVIQPFLQQFIAFIANLLLAINCFYNWLFNFHWNWKNNRRNIKVNKI